MTAPLIYNDFSISVTPEELKAAGRDIAGVSRTELGGWVGEISKSLERIIDIIDDLKLGWAGKTSEEARAFFAEWGAAMRKLFGSPKHPEDGTLFLAATALRFAGNNYDAAEDYIIDVFAKLGQALAPQPEGSGASPGDYLPPPKTWTTEWWQGAVAEIF